MTKCDKPVKKVTKVTNYWKKSHKVVGKSLKMSQTSEKKTEKCKFNWQKVTKSDKLVKKNSQKMIN